MAGKRKVPEFLCPLKYRTGLPDHTAACLPPLLTCSLPNLSTSSLVSYRATALEGGTVAPCFDVLLEANHLGDFSDLSVFTRTGADGATNGGTAASEDVAMEGEGVDVTSASRRVQPMEKRPESAVTSTTTLAVSSTTHSLVSFDHDPHLTTACTINMAKGDGTAILESCEHRLTEFEVRPLGPTEHDYFVVVGDAVYPIGARLQLRRRR